MTVGTQIYSREACTLDPAPGLMREVSPIRVLFLSLQESHEKIFRLVEKELRYVCKEVECTTLDANKLSYSGLFRDTFDKRKVQQIKLLIDTIRPDVVCLANDHMGINATFVKICNLRGIPSVAIQDGILSERSTKDVFNLLRLGNYFLWKLLLRVSTKPIVARISLLLGWRTRIIDWGFGGTTKIAVFGEFSRRLLVSRGTPQCKIVTTGYPLLDKRGSLESKANKPDVCRKLGLQPEKHIALLITQPFVEDGILSHSAQTKLVERIVEIVEELPHLQLVVKLHPREKPDKYQRIVNRKKTVFLKDFDLNKLLTASSVVLTVSSTVGLWALAYGKPLILVDCYPSSVGGSLSEVCRNVAFNVRKLEDLRYVLDRTLNTRSRLDESKLNSFLQDQLFRLDGRASRRIAELILHLTEKAEECA